MNDVELSLTIQDLKKEVEKIADKLEQLIKRVDILEDDFRWTSRKVNDLYEP